MSLTRRQFMWSTAASALWLPRAFGAQAPASSGRGTFQHGIASGDPLADRVVLWTRVTTPGDRAQAVEVNWRIARDSALEQVVGRGTTRTGADRDYTVKIDAGGLEPGRPYFYAFEAMGEQSPIGRTKTLPAGPVARVRLASVCCSNYPAGYFNVYQCLTARDDLDAVVHLGDYIYEFENGRYGDGTALDRIPRPNRETVTLQDYRTRYATYHTDPDLQEVHQKHPFIAVWDDHELTNNAWSGGAQNHDPGEGEWAPRRAAAYRAYLEWMPVRETAVDDIRLYRSFRFGSLLDLIMLDTRGLRDRQAAQADLEMLADPGRSLFGAAQEAWLFDQLRASQAAGTAWRMLGQQVMFSRLVPIGRPVLLPDSWDGYQASRDRLFDLLAAARIEDLAILSGDMHSSWAFDVPRNPWDGYQAASGSGSLAVEFIAPAISSPPMFADPRLRERAPLLKAFLPHLKFLEGDHRGYVLLDVTAARVQADWYHVPTVLERSTAETRAVSFVCERGSSHLVAA